MVTDAFQRRSGGNIEALVAELDQKIVNGVWKPGDKLPTERELEETFGISRNTLRKGLRRLTDEGKIDRQVGRGSYVTYRQPSPTVASISPEKEWTSVSPGDLFAIIQGASPQDIMDLRLLIEPETAELAAYRAGSANLAKMHDCLARMDDAVDLEAFETWDGRLHETIVRSARNDLLTALYSAVNCARDRPEWLRLKRRSATPEKRAIYQQQHREIVEAIASWEPERARSLMTQHLRAVRENLLSA